MIEQTLPQAPVVRHGIVGTGEMADRIREFAWETTSLGPIPDWPLELLITINMVLSQQTPIQVLWGPQMILLYNDAWAPLLVDRHPEALGQPGAQFWSAAWHLVGEELEGVFRTGVPTSHTEVMITVLREGRVQEVWWDYSYNPVFDRHGKVAGVLNISRDVTAQREALRLKQAADAALNESQAELLRSHEALQTERSRLMSVWQQAPVFFALLVGPEHRIALTNAAYRKLIGHRDVEGKIVAEALPEAAAQGYVAVLDKVLSTGEPFIGQGAVFSIAPAPGLPPEDRILDFTYQAMREEDGTIYGVVAIGVDITDNKRAERALVQNEKLAAVGRLASSIAHEINNPLEAVTNLLYLARREEHADQRAAYLEAADGELRRVSAITNQTLRFHKQATRAEEIAAEPLLDSVLRIYRGRMNNAHVEAFERLRAQRPVLCFEGEVRQVLANLVSNAIDAMALSGGGRLFLRSRDGRDWGTGRGGMILTIADSGPGMTESTLQRIFEPFFTTKGIGGTGLGLWISAEIVQRHSGHLFVRSAQGSRVHGTVFRLFLPYESRPAVGDTVTVE